MKEERLVHRLEAFSDIVIGFVLAEMAITLAIPKTAPTTNELLGNLGAFAVTFGLVAIVWSLHNRLFAIYFVPNALMTVVNFAMLAALVMMGYVFSLAMHFASRPGAAPLLSIWFYCFAVVYFLIAAMYGIGAYLRRAELTPREFSFGVGRCMSSMVGTLALALVGTFFAHAHHARQLNGVLPYVALLAVISIAIRTVIGRRLLTT